MVTGVSTRHVKLEIKELEKVRSSRVQLRQDTTKIDEELTSLKASVQSTTKLGRPPTGEWRKCIDCGTDIYIRRYRLNKGSSYGNRCKNCRLKAHPPPSRKKKPPIRYSPRSKKPRPYRAGEQLAEALCETANILYLRDNRKQYLNGIMDRVESELKKMEKEVK